MERMERTLADNPLRMRGFAVERTLRAIGMAIREVWCEEKPNAMGPIRAVATEMGGR